MTTARWLSVRLTVGVAAVGSVLAMAQFTLHALVSTFSNLTPYAGP